MTTSISGRCACGATRFRCEAEPVAMYNCHCRGCRMIGGAPYAALLVLPAAKTEISGAVKPIQQRILEDRHRRRSGCAECGMPLFAYEGTAPDLVLVNAVALDDAGCFKAVADIWTASALPWVHLDYHIPKVFKSPPVLGGDVA